MPLTRLYEKHFWIIWDKSLTPSLAITVIWSDRPSDGYTVFTKSHAVRVITARARDRGCRWENQHVDEDQNESVWFDGLSKCKLKSLKINNSSHAVGVITDRARDRGCRWENQHVDEDQNESVWFDGLSKCKLTLWLPGRGACQDPDILV